MITDIEKACSFTGHRQVEKNFDHARFKEVLTAFIDEGYTHFLCGMAMGFDMLAAELIIELKKDRPQIRLIACVPCEGQSRYFPAAEKERYEKILSKCDEVKVLSNHYYNGCMLVRDRYMVDNSSLLIAYKRVNEGGTYYTLKYALKQNKRICLV